MKTLKLFFLSLILILSLSTGVKAEYFSDVIVTSPNGIWTDTRAFATLNAAVTAIGTAQRTILIASPQIVTTLTVPSNVTLKFERDGSITNSGQLTINTKNIIADDHQIFTGLGDIDFAPGTVVRLSWFWNFWNAISVTSDDKVTLVINKAITATASCAVGNDVTLKWESSGSLITANNGVVISNIGQIEAGDYQILAGAGNFRFRDGTTLNLKWFPMLRTALTWINTNKETLYVDSSSTVDYSDSIPSNIQMQVNKGGNLSVSPGITLTIDNAKQMNIGPYYSDPFIGTGSVAITGGYTYTPATTLTALVLQGLVNDPLVTTYLDEVDALINYGTGTSYTDTTLMAACTAVGSNYKTIRVRRGTWTQSANKDYYAVCPNATFLFANGSIISHGAFTISLPKIQADLDQVFNGTGGVTYHNVSDILFEWYGVTQVGISKAIVDASRSGATAKGVDGKTYTVTNIIEPYLEGNVAIEGKFKILLNGSLPALPVMKIWVQAHDLDIKDFIVDANNTANGGLAVYNQSANMNDGSIGDLTMTDIQVKNVRRTALASPGTGGIYIVGGYKKVVLVRPVVKNVFMVTGTNNPGNAGVVGISIPPYSTTGYARDVSITDPYIENITSDTGSSYGDQDGIAVATPSGTTTTYVEDHVVVRGGTFRNCWGRSMKFQAYNVFVSGSHFYRNTGFNTGVALVEIDFQRGRGQVSNIEAYYDGFAPVTIVNGIQGLFVTQGIVIDGIHVFNNTAVLEYIAYSYESGVGSVPAPLFVSNVSVFGSVWYFAYYKGRNATSAYPATQVNLDNCYASTVLSGAVEILGNGVSIATSITNCSDGAAGGKPLVVDTVAGASAYGLVSSFNNHGFATSFQNGIGVKADIFRPKQIGSYTNTATDGGATAQFYVILLDDAEYAFPQVGLSANYNGFGFYEIMAGGYTTAQAIVTGGTNTLASVYAGTGVAIGTSGTNPNTDVKLNIWMVNGVIHIKNRLGGTAEFVMRALAI